MAAIESEATFLSRALAIGLTRTDVDALKAKHVATFGGFAFLVVYNMNANDGIPLLRALEKVLQREPDDTEMALWRRLQFDSHTAVMSDARARVERTDDSAPRRLPQPEKTARFAEQKRSQVHIGHQWP